jgi:hypothetical protein
LSLGSIDVVDPHAGICPRRRLFDHQELVSTHADMAVTDPADFLMARPKRFLTAIDNDEIVTETVHLQE